MGNDEEAFQIRKKTSAKTAKRLFAANPSHEKSGECDLMCHTPRYIYLLVSSRVCHRAWPHQRGPRIGAHHAVSLQAIVVLERADREVGGIVKQVAATAHGVIKRCKLGFHLPDQGIGVAILQPERRIGWYRCGCACGRDGAGSKHLAPSDLAHNAIDLDAVGSLEGTHCQVRAVSEIAIGCALIVVEALELGLQLRYQSSAVAVLDP